MFSVFARTAVSNEVATGPMRLFKKRVKRLMRTFLHKATSYNEVPPSAHSPGLGECLNHHCA